MEPRIRWRGTVLVLLFLLPGCTEAAVSSRTPVATPSTQQYHDMTSAELAPEHDGLYVCLYGTLHWGGPVDTPTILDKEVRISGGGSFGDSTVPFEAHQDVENVLVCGQIYYLELGRGTKYEMDYDIMTTAPGESPLQTVLSTPRDCRKAHGTARRNICYWKFALDWQDGRWCDSISDPEIKDSCFHRTAQARQDPALCDRIRPDTMSDWTVEQVLLRDVCLGDMKTPDSALCDKIGNDNIRGGCYKQAAYMHGDPGLCAQVPHGTTDHSPRGSCYGYLAYKLNDLSLCEQLTDAQERDWCYFDYAGISKKYGYCDRVSDKWRDTCRSSAVLFLPDGSATPEGNPLGPE